MERFFNPRSVVIVGATTKEGKVGYSIVNNMKDFKGKVYYVNIKGKEINGKEVYMQLKDIKDPIDLVVVATPAVTVPRIIRNCAEKGIKNVIVLSSKFKEQENEYLEEEVFFLINKHKIRLLGPSSLGIYSGSLNLSLAKETPLQGTCAFVSQGGTLWSAITEASKPVGIGFSKFVSLGDMGGITPVDVLEYLSNDKATKSIILSVDSLKEVKGFTEAVKLCKKPIILLGGDDPHIVNQSNAMVVDSVYGALYLAKFLEDHGKVSGTKLTIVSNGGAPAALLSHMLEDHMDININDLLGDADEKSYKAIFTKLKKKKVYSYVVVIATPQVSTPIGRIAKEVALFSKSCKAPVLSCFMGSRSYAEAHGILYKSNVTCFSRLDDVARLLKNL